VRALKGLEEFSHIHIFYLEESEEVRLQTFIGEVISVEMKTGEVELFLDESIDKFLQIHQEVRIIDIKPYFPCEDSMKGARKENIRAEDLEKHTIQINGSVPILSDEKYPYNEARCPFCHGLGTIMEVDEDKIIEKPYLSVLDGASSFWGKLRNFQENPNANWMKGQVIGLANKWKIDLEQPWEELPIKFREQLLHGTNETVTLSYHNKKNGRRGEIVRTVEGECEIIKRIYEEHPEENTVKKYTMKVPCNNCKGERLVREGRMVTIQKIHYPEVKLKD